MTGFLHAAEVYADDERPTRHTRLLDLTYTFSPTFPQPAPPPIERSTAYTIQHDGFYAQKWSFWEHEGTHLDAPGHFIPGGRLVPELEPSELLFVPAEVINIADRAASNPDTGVEVADLVRHERRHGRIAPGTMVLMNSGWGSRANDPAKYLNPDSNGVYRFPGFTPEAADFLVERHVRGIGVDTISIDLGINGPRGFPTHHHILGADHFALENLANLDQMPPSGARLLIGIVKWEAGSGGPCRVIAQS
jgi:kynurenine formamidase